MTELVDVIKVEITLHHCRDGLMIEPLRRWVWEHLHDIMQEVEPCQEGFSLHNHGAISVRWSHTGLHEIPEENGSDN